MDDIKEGKAFKGGVNNPPTTPRPGPPTPEIKAQALIDLPKSSQDHSIVFKTLKSLEDEGLQVIVAYHIKDNYSHKIERIFQWAAEAFDQGSEWVSVVVVSSPPEENKNRRLTND